MKQETWNKILSALVCFMWALIGFFLGMVFGIIGLSQGWLIL